VKKNQKTIKKSFSLSGIGLHSGEKSEVLLSPAQASSGIIFKAGKTKVPALVKYAVKETNKTSLEKDGKRIETIEHLMAALYSLGVDNVLIEIKGGELPILDGSALPWVIALQKAGEKELSAPKKIIKIPAPLLLDPGKDGSLLVATPLNRLQVSFVLNWPVIGSQFFSFDQAKHSFKECLAPARTFGLAEDLEKLQKQGLAKGASLETALGIGREGYLNPPRFPNEPVRHKILDLLGDLALLGAEVHGHIVGIKSGHALNLELEERLEDIYE